MAIPYNDQLQWSVYSSNPEWHKNAIITPPSASKNISEQAMLDLLTHIFIESVVRTIQFLRDGARLVLKVPVRSALKPIILSKNWRELERTKINVKLTGYAFVQLVFVPIKSVSSLAAYIVAAVSKKGARWLIHKNKKWTAHIDGRASQLEALKEVGAKNAADKEQYKAYRKWLYKIDPKLCVKEPFVQLKCKNAKLLLAKIGNV